MRAILVIFLLALLPSPAAFAGDGSLIGGALGAAAGGLFGSQVGRGGGQLLTTTLGVLGGGWIGSEIGHGIDLDTAENGQAPEVFSFSEQPSFIFAPYVANYVAPPEAEPAYADEGTLCRPYSQEILIAGRLAESYGTACLEPDGTWRIVR